jgi:hypothetical protein
VPQEVGNVCFSKQKSPLASLLSSPCPSRLEARELDVVDDEIAREDRFGRGSAVENAADGKTHIRGKAWPTGEPEPPGWLIDQVDPIPNKQGSPGLFADAQFGVYFDNYKVTANQ